MSAATLDRLSQAVVHRFSALGVAAAKFHKQRAEYYEYLADLLSDSAGRRNLINIFESDVQRYAGTPRGVLSQHWLERFQENGARLSDAWAGTLPERDLMILRVAENTGGDALVQSLRDVARVTSVIDEAAGSFRATVAVGLVGLVIALAMVLAIPFGILPSIKDSFSFVPEELWGAIGTKLLAVGRAVEAVWPLLVFGVVAAVGWTGWALGNLTGPLRSWLDKHVLIFRLYRDFRGALFLAGLSSMVRYRGGSVGALRLTPAIREISDVAEPWLKWHCEQILENIHQGGALTPECFDTGVLDRETLFYLLDMAETKGLDGGLQMTGKRTESRVVKVINKRAVTIRWVMLGSALLIALAVGLSTMATIFEMKAALVRVMSG
jgi:hypothetical protein